MLCSRELHLAPYTYRSHAVCIREREDDLHEFSPEGVGVVVGVSYISLPIHTEVMQFVLEREREDDLHEVSPEGVQVVT